MLFRSIGGKGGFEFIQKYTGYVSPVIFAVFLLGFFWKKTTARAALVGIISGTMLSILFDKILPLQGQYDTWLYTAFPNESGVYAIPFLVQMGWVFLFTCLIMAIVSLLDKNIASNTHTMQIDTTMFKVEPRNMVLIIIILVLVLCLYIRFW